MEENIAAQVPSVGAFVVQWETQYTLKGFCVLSHARYTLEIAPEVTRCVKTQKHFKGYWVPHCTTKAPRFYIDSSRLVLHLDNNNHRHSLENELK